MRCSDLKKATNGIYLSPLRILALENFERLNREGVKCNLATGEEEINIEGCRHHLLYYRKIKYK